MAWCFAMGCMGTGALTRLLGGMIPLFLCYRIQGTQQIVGRIPQTECLSGMKHPAKSNFRGIRLRAPEHFAKSKSSDELQTS
jgi:hypothetical protein